MTEGVRQGAPRGTEIRKQIQLPFSKAFQIALNSIRIRFWRSMITAGGIFLGIAFFTSVRMSAEFADIQAHVIQQKKLLVEQGKLAATPEITQQIQSANATKEEETAAKNRLQWLSIMGLLVCTVGITNAMLMSVTERYKEIGTMKCLGALDSLVVKLFFIESCLLGFIASVIGFLIGWLFISIVNLFTSGLEVFGVPYWKASLLLAFTSAGVGTLLTLLATIAPAIRAAQMPPAAALRVEV